MPARRPRPPSAEIHRRPLSRTVISTRRRLVQSGATRSPERGDGALDEGRTGAATREPLPEEPLPEEPLPEEPLPEEHGNHLRAVARGGSLNLAGAIASGVLNFALVVIVTRGLGAAGVGAFFSALALFNLLSRTAELGTDTGLVRTIARYRALERSGDIRRTLIVSLVPALAVSCLFALAMGLWSTSLAELVGEGAGQGDLASYARALAPFIPLATVYLALLSATRGFGAMLPTVALEKIGKPLVQPLLVLVVLAAGLGTSGLAIAWAAPTAGALVLSWWWLARLLRHDERRREAQQAVRSIGDLAVAFWRFTLPRAFAGIFQIAALSMNTLLVGGLGSTAQAGVYAAATRYVTAGLLAGNAVQQVMGPKISELLARKDFAGARAVYQAATSWLVIVTWPLYLTFAVFPTVLLRAFGAEFEAGSSSLALLGAAMLVATAVGPVDTILLMGGRSAWNLINTVAALAVNLALNIALIPRLGVLGAAIAWSACILVNNLAPMAQVWRLMRLHPFGRGTLRAVLCSAACYGGVGVLARLVLGPTIPGLVVHQVLAGVLYLALLWRYRHTLELPVLGQALRGRGRGKQALAGATPASPVT